MVAALGILGTGGLAQAQTLQSWLAETSIPLATGQDSATAAARFVGEFGEEFVIVTGYASTPAGGRVFATHKYFAEPQAPAQQNDVDPAYYPNPFTTTDIHEVAAVAIDPKSRRVYVVGTSSAGSAGNEIVLIKYDEDLIPIWETSWGTTDNDRAVSVVFDDHAAQEMDRRIYVTGTTDGYGTMDDIMTLSFEPMVGDLSPDWALLPSPPAAPGNGRGQRRYNNELYNGPESASDMAFSIPFESPYAHIFVVGTAYNGGNDDDIFVIAYDEDGDVWNAPFWPQYFDASGLDDEGVAIARDIEATGNFDSDVYIAGTVERIPVGSSSALGSTPGQPLGATGGAGGAGAAAIVPDTDYVTIEYSRSGGPYNWYQSHDGPDLYASSDKAVDIITQNGVVATTGTVRNGGRNDIETALYLSNGSPAGVGQYGNILYDENVTAMVKSESGVFLTGWVNYYDLDFAPTSYLTLKYSSSWTMPQWAVVYPGNGLDPNTAHAIAAGDDDDVFVSGASQRGASGEDNITIRYKDP